MTSKLLHPTALCVAAVAVHMNDSWPHQFLMRTTEAALAPSDALLAGFVSPLPSPSCSPSTAGSPHPRPAAVTSKLLHPTALCVAAVSPHQLLISNAVHPFLLPLCCAVRSCSCCSTTLSCCSRTTFEVLPEAVPIPAGALLAGFV